MVTLQMSASRRISYMNAATVSSANRRQVKRRTIQIPTAHITAKVDNEGLSDSADQSHCTTSGAVAKPSTAHTMTTRRQPGRTSRDAVHARKPQAATPASPSISP